MHVSLDGFTAGPGGEMDLIDEYRMRINPILLGNGIPLFKESVERQKLKLTHSRQFGCGVAGVHYERDRT